DETGALQGAFSKCFDLKEIYFEKGTEKVIDNLFAGCTGLEEITLPSYVKKIGANAFAFCSSLKKAFLSANLNQISSTAFYGTGLKDDLSKVIYYAENSIAENYAVKYANENGCTAQALARQDINAQYSSSELYTFSFSAFIDDVTDLSVYVTSGNTQTESEKYNGVLENVKTVDFSISENGNQVRKNGIVAKIELTAPFDVHNTVLFDSEGNRVPVTINAEGTALEFSLEESQSITLGTSCVTAGHLTGQSEITMLDALLTFRYISCGCALTAYQKISADYNMDSYITMLDAMAILIEAKKI
ncbi:MAG: leucine-rich repeat protein, partial [Clostridiales bacterium]|nr:leucine-rich repeat protein [Clostridiales bacterium]